jgi:type II secretory pathway component GspD/PulD (secretin)
MGAAATGAVITRLLSFARGVLPVVGAAMVLATGVFVSAQVGQDVPLAAGTFRLQVVRDAEVLVSFEAEGARLADIGAALAQQMGIPVSVSPEAGRELITTRFSRLPVQTAVTILSRRSFIDYELRADRAVVLGIQFLTVADPPPPRGISAGVMIEGHTEDRPDPLLGQALQTSYEDGRMTLVVRRQPLRAVVAAISEMLGVPYTAEYAATELVDANLQRVPPEVALVQLSPGIRVEVRADLFRGERTVRRIVIGPAPTR